MDQKHILKLCMGSACHQMGVYFVLPRLQDLIQRYELESKLELKGAFCLNQCQRGIVLHLDDTVITDVTPENVEEKFQTEILTRMEHDDQ